MIGQTQVFWELMPKGKRATIEEAAIFDAKLRAALDEASAEGLKAVDEFMKTSTLVKDGIVYDTAGWAFVEVRTPTYHFREALKRVTLRKHGFHGRWTVLGFGKEMPRGAHQSMSAHEIACKAALPVIASHFPDEDFTIDLHMD